MIRFAVENILNLIISINKGDSFKCWAFSTATMLRSSLRETIKGVVIFINEKNTKGHIDKTI